MRQRGPKTEVAGGGEAAPAKQDVRKVIRTLFDTITASNRGGVGETKQRGAETRKWGVEETQHQRKKLSFDARTASNGVDISKTWHRGPKTEDGCGGEPAPEK